MGAICKEKRTNRAEELTEELLVMATQRGADIKLPTMQELCRQFDVARGTLERALTPLEQRGLLYRKHGSGIYVSPSIHQKTIGVVFGGNIFDSVHYSPFWLLLLQAVRQQAAERKHQPLAYLDIAQAGDGLGGHARLIEDLENRRLHGLLLLAPLSLVDEGLQLGSYGVPLVVFGGHSSAWTVTHDWRPVFSLAARELATRGCRRVAILGLASDADRQQLERELRETGYEGDSVLDWSYLTWVSRLTVQPNFETFGRELARRMIADRANTPLPDGLLSLDDTMTHGALHAFEEAGLQPGRDIQIATTSNKGSPVLEPYTSNLIAIEYDPAADVRAALDVLDILMAGGKPPQNPVLIGPKLVPSASAEEDETEGEQADRRSNVARASCP